MKIISYLIILIIILVGVSFAVLNAEPVVISYFFGSRKIQLSLLLVLTLGCGALIGLFICLFPYLNLKRKNTKLRKRVQVAEKEVENLRAIPLKDEH